MLSIENLKNTIIHGNSLQILKSFPSGEVDLILTDPPYGISNENEYKITFTNGKPEVMSTKNKDKYNDTQTEQDMFDMYEQLATLYDNVLSDTGSIITFYDRGKPHLLMPFYNKFKFRNTMVFVKSNPQPHMHMNNYRSGYEACAWFSRDKYNINFLTQKEMINVFDGRTGKHKNINETEHPAEKYKWMIEPLIKIHSKEKDVILDPFSGSGRISVEAKLLGRNFVGIEIEEKYVEMSRTWLNKTPFGSPEKNNLKASYNEEI